MLNEELFPRDNFLHNKIKKECDSQWDYSSTCCHTDYSHLNPNPTLEVTYMCGCVTSPYDVAGGGQSLLDAACRVIDSGQIDSQFDTLECYSFLRDMFKEDDTLPSSTSSTVTTTGTSESISNCDVQIINNSNIPVKLYHETIPQKPAIDCPPDDVRAFFGHPLTRSTSALNGTETDTTANAEALLHEYKHLPSMEDDDRKEQEKLHSFLDIVSDQISSPQLSSTRQQVSSSLTPDQSPPSPISGRIHLDVEEDYNEASVEDCSQNVDDIAMTAYVNIFLQDNIQLEDYILNTQTADQEESNTVEVEPEGIKFNRVKKARLAKRNVGSALQRRCSKDEVKRATRKSRTKSNAVTSTTNDLSGQITEGQMSEHHSGAACPQPDKVGVFLGHSHQFESEGAVVASTDPTNVSSVVASSVTANTGSSTLSERHVFTTYSSASTATNVNSISTVAQQQPSHPTNLQFSQFPRTDVKSTTLNFPATSITTNNVSVFLGSSSNQAVTAVSSSSTQSSASTVNTSSIPNASSTSTNSENISKDSFVKEKSGLKQALSEKIRCRQSADESMQTLALQFIPDHVSGMRMDAQFSPAATIKQEDPYIDHFEQQYTYGSDIVQNMHSLTNCSALSMTAGSSLHNILPVTMGICDGEMTTNEDDNNNRSNDVTPRSFHHFSNTSTDHLSFHQHRQHLPIHQQQHCHLSQSNSNRVAEDPMIVQSSQGQYFPSLHQLQSVDSNSHIPNTTCNTGSMNNSEAGYYNNVYNSHPNTELLETNKQMVVGRYLHQQYAYGNGYTQFLNPENYSMRSPDSGFHEPCLSPTSSAVAWKDVTSSGSVDEAKEKPKKKKSTVGGMLTRQYSSSESEKASPRSPAIQKLDVNNTGYTYFMETPISTTQRRNEDRITYLNKSQYYGLSLEFNTQERVIKCAVVKSVIILTFREEKEMKDERRAWEFWHGRQHSYKQRILDIDTKNCHGVLPQNIEELSFNAVAVKWNPMEGPVKVNIAVHCLSTDFSNQKGVKGIPLHIQIDTYEQTPKESHLVHRGYCQIKAFCDKGAERKTRDEERRKASKGKPDEFGQVSVSNKGRRKVEESFHEPCERSAFYSMVNTTTPPVFFNPLIDSTEFIHKSLTVGVVPSQDEEVSSLPNKLDLPDSCDDYYINSPAKKPRRDSFSNLKDEQKVLLYIRERHETAYTALMLEVPTLHGLLRSIELKYSIAPSKVKNFYKRSRKGILVKLDDIIVQHYSHEATFIIETNILNESGDYEIILVEIDPVSS